MTTRRSRPETGSLNIFRIFLIFLCAAVFLIGFGTGPQLAQHSSSVSTTTGRGISSARFETELAWIVVNLPDDLAAGDVISGTVVVTPKGPGPVQDLKHSISIAGEKYALPSGQSRQTFSIKIPVNLSTLPVELGSAAGKTMNAELPVGPPAAGSPNSFPFSPPDLAQAGRPLQIPGNFDGDLSNTSCAFGAPGGALVDGLPLAESPRKAVFETPGGMTTGPTQLTVNERGSSNTTPLRIVGLQLSAPKTELIRGESTTVKVQVTGLQDLQQTIPMQLDCSGVVEMSGGNQQTVEIKPSDVNANGEFLTSRVLTGTQAGGFVVNATVQANNQACALSDKIVHVEGKPYGGSDGLWFVKVKTTTGMELIIRINDNQRPNLQYCNWIKINSCQDGVVPAESRHGYDLTKNPLPQPGPSSGSSATSSPSPTPGPSPSPGVPPGVSTGCKDGDSKHVKRDTSLPYKIVDGDSEFKAEVTIITDTKGRQEARDLATIFRGISTVGSLLKRLLPKGAPDIGMGANVASLIFAELDAGAKILDQAANARLTSAEPAKFKIDIEVKTKEITPYCDTYLVCRNGAWVTEKKYGQSEGSSLFKVTKSIEITGPEWHLVSTGEKFDAGKADKYARDLAKSIFATLSGNQSALAAAPAGCK